MNREQVERIRKINAKKAHGHIDSAVSHCAFLLNYIDVLEQQNSNGEERSRVECLAMFVRRMQRIMSMNGLADREVCKQAQTYLKTIGATGSVLRDEDIEERAERAVKMIVPWADRPERGGLTVLRVWLSAYRAGRRDGRKAKKG